MMAFLLDPFSYAFMQQALLVSTLISTSMHSTSCLKTNESSMLLSYIGHK